MTTAPSTPASRPSNNQRLTSVEQKLERITHPGVKGSLPRTTRGVEKAHRRINAVEELLATINGRVDTLQTALQAGIAGGTKSFLATLRDAGIDDESLARTLIIVRTPNEDGSYEELNLTDAQMFAETLTALGALQAQVSRHELLLSGDPDAPENSLECAGIVRTVSRHSIQLNDLVNVVGTDRQENNRFRQQVVASQRQSLLPYILGAIAGVIAFIAWKSTHTDSTTLVQQGKHLVTVNSSGWQNSTWYAIFFGVLVGALVALIVGFFTRNRIESETTEETENSSSSNSRFAFWRRTTQETTTTEQATPQAAPAPAQPTQVLPPAQPAEPEPVQ